MRRTVAILMTLFLLAGLLTACGQKGPLYLPEEDGERRQFSS